MSQEKPLKYQIHHKSKSSEIFLALCYQYLGGEGNIMLELTGKTINHPPRLIFDLPANDSYWSNDEFMFATKQSVGFKPAKDPTIVNSIKDNPSHFTPGTFVSYAPSTYSEPLPWDIVDSQLNSGGYSKTWHTQNPNVIPSVSASIKATIDPTDILVDAVHNFHPTYRHYTQTQMDEDS
ncbi:hypothetical protein MN116_009039 [Schistosoma mekongi]|uniref:Uncharacterized protein n=1 Tax=Schistosoma mekongi TaxID=38744 RepID=A0AAE1Z5W2_SCHME|nr:hypothetical protein MN116_009039 [Schistosoma mekongi]